MTFLFSVLRFKKVKFLRGAVNSKIYKISTKFKNNI